VETDKLRFLIKGKIITDAKTVSEVVGEDGGEAVVSVMLMGGAVVKERPPLSTVDASTTTGTGGGSKQVDEMQVDKKDGSEDVKAEVEKEEGGEVGKDKVMEDVVRGPSLTTKMEDETLWQDISTLLQKRDFSNDEVDAVMECFRDAWKKRTI